MGFGLSEMNWKGGIRVGVEWGKVRDSCRGYLGGGLGRKTVGNGCSGSGLTADSSVLTLTLAFLDFGLDFAQSFPFHAQFCHFGLGKFYFLNFGGIDFGRDGVIPAKHHWKGESVLTEMNQSNVSFSTDSTRGSVSASKESIPGGN
ncbi:hypothetical protein Tco_0720454 [Tanacetum coccineum]